MTKPRRAAAVELLAFYGLIIGAIWIGQTVQIHVPVLLLGLILIAFCSLSNHRHGDSRERIGLDFRHFKKCARLTAKIAAGPIVVLALLAARQPLPAVPKIIFGIVLYPIWAFAQDYALLSFSANRLEDILGQKPWLAAVLNGVLFSLVHLPNPMLVISTFIGGCIFTWIFFRCRNLLPIALAHAWSGFLLSIIFQANYNAMMVGPAYFKYLGVPGPHP